VYKILGSDCGWISSRSRIANVDWHWRQHQAHWSHARSVRGRHCSEECFTVSALWQRGVADLSVDWVACATLQAKNKKWWARLHHLQVGGPIVDQLLAFFGPPAPPRYIQYQIADLILVFYSLVEKVSCTISWQKRPISDVRIQSSFYLKVSISRDATVSHPPPPTTTV
jgi:hypothetical protein